MSAEWFLMQYTHDLRRHEPRNVGVLLRDNGNGWHFRFLGQRQPFGKIDGNKVKGLQLDRELFETWVKYYVRSALTGRWEETSRYQRERPTNFSVISGGIQLHDVADWEAFTETLFLQLVAGTEKKTGDDLDTKIRRLFREAKVPVKENIELDGQWSAGGSTHKIRFDFGVQARQLVVMERVPLRSQQVYNFKGRMDAVRLKGSASNFIALTAWTDDDDSDVFEDLLQPLEETASALNVDENHAVDRLRELIGT